MKVGPQNTAFSNSSFTLEAISKATDRHLYCKYSPAIGQQTKADYLADSLFMAVAVTITLALVDVIAFTKSRGKSRSISNQCPLHQQQGEQQQVEEDEDEKQ